MSKLWRSFPPIYLILWLSKWLRNRRRGWWGRNDPELKNWKPTALANIPTVHSGWSDLHPKPLKGKSKPAPKVLVGIDRKGEVLRYKYDGEQLTKLPEPHDYEPTEGINYKKKRRLS